jgi:hypothetical protein
MQTMRGTWYLKSLSACFLCGWFLAVVNGCSTPNGEVPDPGVEIRWNTPGQISNMVREVFLENGFASAKGDYTKLVFEKKASLGHDLVYGGWSRQGLWFRVKVSMVSAGEATFRLSCKGFTVEDRGDALEEATPMSVRQNEKYNKLLEEVAKRLQGAGEKK